MAVSFKVLEYLTADVGRQASPNQNPCASGTSYFVLVIPYPFPRTLRFQFSSGPFSTRNDYSFLQHRYPQLSQETDIEAGSPPPTPTNSCIFQGFEWYVAPDGKHWRRLARDIPALEQIGVTAMWIPPACKGGGAADNGYGIYGNPISIR